MVMRRTKAEQMRTQAVSPLSRAAVGILPPVGRRRRRPEPAAIPRPFCRFCRCSGETKVPTNVTDNIVGNDQKGDKTVCPGNGAWTACAVGAHPPGSARVSEGRRRKRADRTKMSVLRIRHTFSSSYLCRVRSTANPPPVAVAASTEARTDLRSLSVLSEIGKSLASAPELRGSLERVLNRKSTRLNSSHTVISYAVFCLKKKKTNIRDSSI